MKFPWPRRIGVRIAVSHIVVLLCAMVTFMAGTALVLFWQMQAQLEHYAIQDLETVEGLMSFATDGTLRVREDYHNHPESKRVLERFLEVRDLDGRLLYRNARLGPFELGGTPGTDEGVGGYSARSGALPDGTRIVMVSRRHAVDGRPTLIRLAYSEESIRHSLNELLAAALWLLPVMFAAAGLTAYRMSRTVLRPIEHIISQAEQITSNRLHERLPVIGTGDELDHLAVVFNHTLARLDQSFRELRQFSADASHELRTPLAAIRTIGEVGLQRDGSREDYRELVGSILEETNRLTQLIDELLMISRADSGAIELHRSTVAAGDMARDAVSLLEPLADEKQQQISITGSIEARIEVDSIFIRQALVNVLHNAIKYSPPRSLISVHIARSQSDDVTIEVRDSGPGIAAEHAERIFDRFYRVDHGRARSEGGFGLGLAIAQWAVRAHGGIIAVSNAPEGGSIFQIALPMAQDGPA
ncbi:MAG TPA: ATP-binding protein [Bryobacteraceae bacterium]